MCKTAQTYMVLTFNILLSKLHIQLKMNKKEHEPRKTNSINKQKAMKDYKFKSEQRLPLREECLLQNQELQT